MNSINELLVDCANKIINLIDENKIIEEYCLLLILILILTVALIIMYAVFVREKKTAYEQQSKKIDDYINKYSEDSEVYGEYRTSEPSEPS
ncbi:MAG: hypothetical protein H7835_07940, partial [Magnetococcus sp. XQGC-1]